MHVSYLSPATPTLSFREASRTPGLYIATTEWGVHGTPILVVINRDYALDHESGQMRDSVGPLLSHVTVLYPNWRKTGCPVLNPAGLNAFESLRFQPLASITLTN